MFGTLCAYPMAASNHRHTLIKIVFFILKDCSSLLFYKDCASRTQRKFTFYVKAKPIFCKDSASRRQRKFTFFVEANTKIAKIIDRWGVHANFYNLHAWRRKSCELKNATPMCYNRGGMLRLWSSQTIVYTMQRSAYCITLWWSKTMAPGPTPVGNVLSNTPDSS